MFKKPHTYILKHPEIVGLGIGNKNADLIEAFIISSSREGTEVDWAALSEPIRSRRYQLNTFSILLPKLAPLLKTGTSTPEAIEALKWAVSIALDFQKKYPFDPSDPEGTKSDNAYAWYDMAVGIRSSVVACIVLHAETADVGVIQKEDLKTLKKMAQDHASSLLNKKYWADHSNHGFYQSYGLFSLSILAPTALQNPAKSKKISLERVLNYLDQSIGNDGLHLEHSTSYHNFILQGLRALQPWLDQSEVTQKKLYVYLEKMIEAQAALIMPNGFYAPIGDTDHSLVKNETISTEELFENRNPPETSNPNGIHQSFYDGAHSGLYVDKAIDDNRSHYFAMMAMFHSRVHKQADDLSLLWSVDGCPIFTDPGRYGYEGKTHIDSALRQDGYYYSDPSRIYVESANAHNSVEVDGKTYNRKHCPPYGSGLNGYIQDQGYTLCQGEWLNPLGVRQKRILLIRPKQSLLVLDFLSSEDGKDHDVSQWFQLFPCWTAEVENNAIEASFQTDWTNHLFKEQGTKKSAQLKRRFNKKIAPSKKILSGIFKSSSTEKVSLHKGETSPRVQGWISLVPRSLQPATSIGHHSHVSSNQPICMAAYFDLDNTTSSIDMKFDGDKLDLDMIASDQKSNLKIDMRENATTVLIDDDISLTLDLNVSKQSQASRRRIIEYWNKAKQNNDIDVLPLNTRSQRLKEDFLGTLARAAFRRIKR